MNNTDATYNEESRGVAMNIFAVLGFIAILLAGLWATVQLVKQISNLSFDFSKPDITMPLFGASDKLALKSNDGVLLSGEKSTLAWELGKEAQEAKDSTLTFSYACKPGAYIKVDAAEAGNYRAIPCNAPLHLETTSTELSIIPVLTNIAEGEIAYSLTYAPVEGDKQIKSGVLKITKNAALAVKPTPTKPVMVPKVPAQPKNVKVVAISGKEGAMTRRTVATRPVRATKMPVKRTVATFVPVRKSDPNGLPDLTVKVLKVSTPDRAGRVTVEIEVANIGTKLAKNWTLNASLPTSPTFTYVSQPQATLYAGERAEMRMTFDKVLTGTGSMLLTVDAANRIAESLETNNSVTQIVVGR